MSRYDEMIREKFHRESSKERTDYSHGSKYRDERGNEYMDDHISGVDWHVPKKYEEDEEYYR